MKTALQQLIDKWEREKGSYIPNAPIFQCFIDDAKAMLQKEKEQMIDAYILGRTGGTIKDFNETYKSE